MLVTGACGLVYEYVLSTVSTYILGNSIEQFSVIIALMLLSMGVAGYLQKFSDDSRLADKFIIAELLLATIGGFAPIAVYTAFAQLSDHFQIILYATVIAVGALIGLEIPLAVRINEKYVAALKGNIASVWGADYIGSFLGAIIWTRVLLKYLPLTKISFVLAGCNLFVALLVFTTFWRAGLVHRRYGILVSFVLVGAALSIGFVRNVGWSQNLEQQLYDEPIVFSETTRYQRLVVTHDVELDDYRLYINGNLQFSSVDEAIYHEMLVLPAMSLVHPKDVLILGGGDGLALREVEKFRDVQNITLVDLDPEMIKLASTNAVFRRLNKDSFHDARVHASASLGVVPAGIKKPLYQESEDDERKWRRGRIEPKLNKIGWVDVYNVDADKFLSLARGHWDVVIVDLPDPNAIELAKLYSQEFYAKIRKRLAPGGMVVVQASSPYHSKEAFLCMKRTMEAAGLAVLPYHQNVPSFGDWGWLLGRNKADHRARTVGNLKITVPTTYLTPDVWRSSLAFGKGMLETEERDVSTLMQPAILRWYVDEGWKIE
jgi:spermidine synthase